MKFWLIIMLFNQSVSDDNFAGKIAIPYKSSAACSEAKRIAELDGNVRMQLICVSDAHYRGRAVDPSVPLD